MKPVFLIVMATVAMIGVMVPSSFAEEINFDEIIITNEQDDKFGYGLTLNDEKLFVMQDGGKGIHIYNSNDGSFDKTLLYETFSESHWLNLDNKIQANEEYIFVNIKLDPYFSECDTGIAMIDYATGKTIHVFTDTELLAYESENWSSNNENMHVLKNKICSKNFGFNFQVFDNYLLVSSPGSQGSYHDVGFKEFVQKPHVVLIDIDTKKVLNIFEDVDFTLSRYSPDNYGNDIFNLEPSDFGASSFGQVLAINEKFIVIGNAFVREGSVSIFDTKTGNLIKKINGEQHDENSYGFGSALTLSQNNLIVGQPGWEYGRVHHFELPSGDLIKTIRSPSPLKDNFGTSLTSNDDFFLVSAYSFGLYFDFDSITEKQLEQLRGTVYMYDFKSGKLIKEFKNSSTKPGHMYKTNLWTDLFGQRVSLSDNKIAVGALGFNSGSVFLYVPQLPRSELTVVSEPTSLGLAGFVDQTKNPQHYIDRYNNEPEYKKWFDTNYPQYESIEQAVGLELTKKIPTWIKSIFGFYSQDKISEDELLNAIQYLINEKILIVN